MMPDGAKQVDRNDSEFVMQVRAAAAMKKALVVDDHPAAAAWVAAALSQAFPGIEIFEGASLAAGRTHLADNDFQIALVDLGLPDGSGIELIRDLHAQLPDVIKVVSTVFGDDGHLFDALRAGADGYVLKDETKEGLVEMLLGIARGEPPLSSSVARRLLTHFHPDAEQPSVHLTERERDVLTLLAKGYTVRRVAGFLDITVNTTAGYVKTIYRKLNVSNRAEATLEATRIGLVGEHNR